MSKGGSYDAAQHPPSIAPSDALRQLFQAIRSAGRERCYPDFIDSGGRGTAFEFKIQNPFALDPDAIAMIVNLAPAKPLVSAAAFGGNGAVLIKEDAVRLEATWSKRLSECMTGTSTHLALNNELAEAFCRTHRNPWSVFKDLFQQAQGFGLTFAGLSRPAYSDPISGLSLILSRSGFAGTINDTLLSQYGLYGVEMTDAQRLLHANDLSYCDGIAGISFVPGKRRRFSAAAWQSIVETYQPVPEYVYETEVALTSRGWILRTNGPHGAIERPASLQEVISVSADPGSSCLVSIDAAAICALPNPASLQCAPGHIRAYPVPFSSALAMSNDIDSTTPEKFRALTNMINIDCGLPLASSFFLMASDPDWLGACEQNGDPRLSGKFGLIDLAHFYSLGLLDTLHGLAEGVSATELVSNMGVYSTPPPFSVPLSTGCGFAVLTSSRTSPEISVVIKGEQSETEYQLICAEGSAERDRNGAFQKYYPLPGTFEKGGDCRWSLLSRQANEIEAIYFVDLAPGAVRSALSRLAEFRINPAVFVAHGNNAQSFGGLMTGVAKGADRFKGRFTGDEPASLYFIQPQLEKAGLKYFNLQGAAGTQVTTKSDSVLFDTPLASGSAARCFRRFWSARYPEYFGKPFAYDKAVSHEVGFATTCLDALNAFATNTTARNAIVYTHLGEGFGNKKSGYVSAPHELSRALQRMAAAYHPEGAECDGRTWVCSTSRLLRHRLAVETTRVELTSGGQRIDLIIGTSGQQGHDQFEFDTKLLDGLSIAVADCKTAELLIDSKATDWVSREIHDGRHWLVIVDNSNIDPIRIWPGSQIEISATSCTAVLHGPASDAAAAAGTNWQAYVLRIDAKAQSNFETRLYFEPLTLLGAQAWSFRLSCSAPSTTSEFSIGFLDENGVEFCVSDAPSDHSAWVDPQMLDGAAKRCVYRFEARNGSVYGPPFRSVTGLFVRGRCATNVAIELSDVCLARNSVDVLPRSETVCLAGRVRDTGRLGASLLDYNRLAVWLDLGQHLPALSAKIARDGTYLLSSVPRNLVGCIKLVDVASEAVLAKRNISTVRSAYDLDLTVNSHAI